MPTAHARNDHAASFSSYFSIIVETATNTAVATTAATINTLGFPKKLRTATQSFCRRKQQKMYELSCEK